jgi:hypothetical protein
MINVSSPTFDFPITSVVLASFCQKHRIRKLSVFGSAIKGHSTSESDLDVLVEFEPHAVVGFFELMNAELELSHLTNRQIDMNTPGFLNDRFREQVLAEAKVIYER